MTLILNGKTVSEKIIEQILLKTNELKKKRGIIPTLAILLVGDNAASHVYVESKGRACEKLGFIQMSEILPKDTSEEEILNIIERWNHDSTIHGILVQLPLPEHIDENKVLLAISPRKDVDGFHPQNIGRLVLGLKSYIPCTPAGILELIKHYKIKTEGKHTVVVGRSNIVGKPIANLMYQKNRGNSIVTICHTAADIQTYTKQADILIVAIGSPNLIKATDIKKGVVIIDVGINRIADKTKPKGTKIVGDVDFDNVFSKASAITPVPGGVGLMTIAMLMNNTFLSASNNIYETH